MEIVKLKTIAEISIGKTPSTKNALFWTKSTSIPFYDGSLTYTRFLTVFAKDSLKLNLTDGNGFIMSIFGHYKPIKVLEGSFYNQQLAFLKSKNEKNILSEYIYFYVLKNEKEISKEGIGSVVSHINKNILANIKISYPSIIVQQEIIDIIKPFEDLKKNILSKIDNLEKISQLLINNMSNTVGLFINENITFNKGINFKNEMISTDKTNLLFINVASINNNPNKFIKNEYKNLINVLEGDVILSLDGNTGLVNNFLHGINGYGYKLISEKHSNSQIYYSLKSDVNQNIIKQNSFGTTIKHASRAKDKIKLLEFTNNEILEFSYTIEINYKKSLKLLNNTIQLLIEKYLF